ncbi:hypothetical protein [Actinocrispum sp. NPDC049592]|uniref:hypothetical protein n=1 Tax=Actinocrispum sp. NPDC049592 TaxID=3154835 RepID=UPI00344AAE6B
MDEILFRALDERVRGHLDEVDRLAATTHPARTAVELHRLTTAWRTLLDLHTPTATRRTNRCPVCRTPGMCPVWKVATAIFVP